jgi:hypothetical protein
MVCVVITCSLQEMAQMNTTLWLTEVIFFSPDIIQCISFRVVMWFGSWRWKIDDGRSPEKEGKFSRHRWTSKYLSSSCPNTVNHFLEHIVSWLDCLLLSAAHSRSSSGVIELWGLPTLSFVPVTNVVTTLNFVLAHRYVFLVPHPVVEVPHLGNGTGDREYSVFNHIHELCWLPSDM